MRLQPMLVVRDVEASSRWYQELLGAESGHGGNHYEMIMLDGTMLLSLHHAEIDEHPVIQPPSPGCVGAGVLLYVSTDDVQPVFERAKRMGADLEDEPHENPIAHTIEFSLRDPDGYAISVGQHLG